MSIRKYSTDNSSDNEYTNEHIGCNRAMLLSESQSLCMDESVNLPKEKFRSAVGFNSVKRLLRNNKKTKIDSDKESQDHGIKMQNTATNWRSSGKLQALQLRQLPIHEMSSLSALQTYYYLTLQIPTRPLNTLRHPGSVWTYDDFCSGAEASPLV